jgi:glycosyl-4,4'-diaponeurosporenoate acyltransferase
MIKVVLVDAAVWAGWGVAVSVVAARVPAEWLGADVGPLRLRPWERGAWERLGIRRWKDAVPEAGAVFGGRSKRSLGGHGRADLEAFAAETRRGEIVHWVVPAAVVAFPLWNPWPLTAVMVAYAAAANVPCLLIQRYNRARIRAILAA